MRPRAEFTIIADHDCPLYEKDDRFILYDIAVQQPRNRLSCIRLSKGVMELIEKTTKDGSTVNASEISGKSYNCPGCSGFIKFTFKERSQYETLQMRMLAKLEREADSLNKFRDFGDALKTSMIFNSLEEDTIKDIVSNARMKRFQPGEIILRKGAPGRYIHVVLFGTVALLDRDEKEVIFLSRGEIFGEMSVLSGQNVCATLRAVEETKTLCLDGETVNGILRKYPYLQKAFTSLLAKRLSESNERTAPDASSSISGHLKDFHTSELFHMIHENMKSGSVEMKFDKGEGFVEFCEGEITEARYGAMEGVNAFYEILKEQNGWFSYTTRKVDKEKESIGGFMKLLMEGLRRIDEQNAGAAEG